MKIKLLLIDPQNDFCDIPGAALPVAGSSADLTRLANFIASAAEALSDILITLDSHAQVAIERVSFWQDAKGRAVAPFTKISAQEVEDGKYRPRNASLLPQVLAYLHALESRGRYRLILWPVHCVLGTRGHAIYAPLALSIAAWEERTQIAAMRVLKGQNPMTEQYSAVMAEVPLEDDATTFANTALLARARPGQGETLLIAGEASSHCVRATVLDLLREYKPEERTRLTLLTDCMSPVSGFENQAEEFFGIACAAGVRLMPSDEALEAMAQ